MNQRPERALARHLNPEPPARSGKTGEGARSAMAQVALDRLSAAHTPESNQGLVAPSRFQDRPIDGLWTLQTWLSEMLRTLKDRALLPVSPGTPVKRDDDRAGSG